MDSNDSAVQQSAPEQQESGRQYTGRAVSPYADSPYISYYEQHGQAHPYKEHTVKEKKADGAAWKKWLAGGLAAVLLVCGCGVTAIAVSGHWQKKYDLLNEATSNRLAALEKQIASGGAVGGSVAEIPEEGLAPADIYKKNVNAVVSISTSVASGTGFILSEDGYVVSNFHVVDGGNDIRVILFDGESYPAELIGYDDSNDVSLLKVEAEGLPCVTVGDSDLLAVGDRVVAIGNALGELTATLTVGYISGKDRVVSTDGTAINMLQTDAAINSGNSGGPLFNAYGEVIGITTAKYSGATNSGAAIEGIGFAIPINDVFGMIQDIRDYGYVTGAYLGVSVRDVDNSVIQNYGFPAGAYVVEVVDGLCAQKGGVQARDIITNLGGYPVDSVNGLTRALRKFKAGDTTTLTVFRSGAEVHLEITFDEKPRPEVSEDPQPSQGQEDAFGDPSWWYDFFAPFFGNG